MPPCGPCGRHRAEGGPGRTIRWTAAPPTHQGPPCPANGRCRVQGPHALAKQGILHGDPPCKQGPGKRVFKGTPAPTGVRPEERLGPEHTPRGTGRTIPGLLPPNGRAHASTQNAGQVVQESSGFRRPGHPFCPAPRRLKPEQGGGAKRGAGCRQASPPGARCGGCRRFRPCSPKGGASIPAAAPPSKRGRGKWTSLKATPEP